MSMHDLLCATHWHSWAAHELVMSSHELARATLHTTWCLTYIYIYIYIFIYVLYCTCSIILSMLMHIHFHGAGVGPTWPEECTHVMPLFCSMVASGISAQQCTRMQINSYHKIKDMWFHHLLGHQHTHHATHPWCHVTSCPYNGWQPLGSWLPDVNVKNAAHHTDRANGTHTP